MKKTIAVAVFLFVVAVTGIFGQTNLLNTNKYFSIFSINKREDIVDSDYVWLAPPEEIIKFGNLNWSGKEDTTGLVDTPLEFALLSYYSPVVIQIRPVEAKTLLPADNPKLADLKLGAALYQDIQVLRFLASTGSAADTNAVGRYEGILKFITDRKNVTRAEIEKYYRDGIRGLIAGIVDEEFNKISFLLENSSIRKAHNAVLTRDPQNGHYTLSYGGVNTNNETKEIKDMTTLDALLVEMGRRRTDFDQTGINQVSAQAKLIPAVVLSDAALNEVKTILTNFYTNPSATTYAAMKEVYALYDRKRAEIGPNMQTFANARIGYGATLDGLNAGLAQKVFADVRASSAITTLTRDQQQRLIQLR
jgi:hypothetical protein